MWDGAEVAAFVAKRRALVKWLGWCPCVRGGGRTAEMIGVGNGPEGPYVDVRPGQRVCCDLGSSDRAVGEFPGSDRCGSKLRVRDCAVGELRGRYGTVL